MIPNEENIQSVAASPFWTAVFVFWIVMLVVAGTLALALAIWNLIQAF